MDAVGASSEAEVLDEPVDVGQRRRHGVCWTDLALDHHLEDHIAARRLIPVEGRRSVQLRPCRRDRHVRRENVSASRDVGLVLSVV